MGKRPFIIAAGIGAGLLLASRFAAASRQESIPVQDAPILEPLYSLFEANVNPNELERYAADPNVAAMQAAIRFAEGTADPDGYRRHFGGDLFDSFADHPRIIKTATLAGRELKSSAAGAYQILQATWDDVAPKIGATDFSPYWQDRAAIYLFKRRGALEDIAAGRFYEALEKLRKEWASLPGAGYGQPEKKAETLAQIFADNGGSFA